MKSSSVYGSVAGIYLGNAEAGTAAGTSNVFENLIFDLTNASFPLGVGTGTQSSPWAGIIAPSRAIDWSQAGVVGGIPNRTTICATLNPGATNAQVQAAAQSCPAGGVVSLSAGSYSMAGLDLTGVNNVTVRGAGGDQTTIVLTGTSGCNLSTDDY